MTKMWTIIGGADKGGILVREGQALSSPAAAARLSCGALVEKLELLGERLHFRRVRGDGPAEGWVSIRTKGNFLALPAVPEAAGEAPAAALAGPASGDMQDGSMLLARYEAGDLDSLIKEFHTVLRCMPGGRFPVMEAQPEARVNGSGPPWCRWTAPGHDNGRPRVVFTGDSITHGPPMANTSPWCQAVAEKNPGVATVNAGWGGAMAFTLMSPGDFNGGDRPIPVPGPRDLGGDYVCVLIGTNDAICISSSDEWIHESYATPWPGPGPFRLPAHWRTTCRPTVELFEEKLGEVVRAYREQGAQVAVATVPMLGEDLTETVNQKQKVVRSPYLVCKALGAAVHRVCAREGCSVLPLFECMEHRIRQLSRPLFPWTPVTCGLKVFATSFGQTHHAQHYGCFLPWEDLCAEKTRPEFGSDLVHFNEKAGALHAALVHSWLAAQLAQ